MAHTQAHTGGASLPASHSAAANGYPWTASLDAVLGALIEIPVAILVAAEIGILFAGVVARFVFRQPLVWSDEFASILFLWLAMLGAVVAFRNEHMRMTAIVGRASPQIQAFLDVFATGAALAFLLLIAWPAFEYAQEETFITRPALEITMQIEDAKLAGVFNMGGAAVANYVSILERRK